MRPVGMPSLASTRSGSKSGRPQQVQGAAGYPVAALACGADSNLCHTIPVARQAVTEGELASAAEDAAVTLDRLQARVAQLLSGISVPAQVQRQHTVSDLLADLNQLQVCIWRLRHMTNSGGPGMRADAQVTACRGRVSMYESMCVCLSHDACMHVCLSHV